MIGVVVETALQDAAYAVDWVRNGQTALDVAIHQHYDLLPPDLGLPGRDGHAVLGSLRTRDNPVPMLILIARGAVDKHVRGPDSGADNYILKPFEVVELFAHMHAVLRREGGVASPVLTNSVLALDPAAYEARIGDAEPVHLSAREFALLQVLILRPGAILSHTELKEHIYGWGREVVSSTVEFLIHASHKKLGAQATKNVRGVGRMVPRGQ